MRDQLHWTIAGLATVTLVGGGLAALLVPDDDKPARTFTVVPVDVRSTATLPGSLASAATYQLYFGATTAVTGQAVPADASSCDPTRSAGAPAVALGPVTSLAVAPGATVTAGQPLAQADASAAQSALDAARKDLSDAEELLAEHRTAAAAHPATYPHSTAAAPGDPTDPPAAPAPTTAPEAALIGPDMDRVARATAVVAELQRTVDSAQLTAPVDGVVQTVTTAVGSTPSCRNPVYVLRTSALAVHVDAPEDLLGRLKTGQHAQVSVTGTRLTASTAVSTLPVAGVTLPAPPPGPLLAPLGRTAPAQRVYPLDLPLAAPPAAALPGMAATVKITLAERLGVLAVPNAAIERDGDGAHVIWQTCAPQGGSCRTRKISVRTGLTGDQLTEILSGLTPGDVIVLPASAPLPPPATPEPATSAPTSPTPSSPAPTSPAPTGPAPTAPTSPYASPPEGGGAAAPSGSPTPSLSPTPSTSPPDPAQTAG